VLPDPAAVAARGAAVLAERARAAVAARGTFSMALSGGSTPWAMLEVLAAEAVPWEHVTVLQVDERVAPAGDEQRNLTHLRAALPADVALLPMPVEAGDLEAAAEAYARLLPRPLDLVHLGLGADGHTASLVPGDGVLAVRDRLVAATAPYQGHRRLTLTYPTLDHARFALWLVTGAVKAEALARLLAGDPALPATHVGTPEQLLLVDRAAAEAT